MADASVAALAKPTGGGWAAPAGGTLAEVFAAYAAGYPSAAIPAEVREAARWHLVDAVGVCLAGANPNEESGAVAARLAGSWSSGEGASLLGLGRKARPDLAALLNGTLAQALEMDDKHGYSLARPGSTVTPAVLALAEARGASLDQALDALIIGYEVMIRLGFVAGERFLERGYHTSSLIGSFGAAAAIGRLLGLPAQSIADAFGICGTFASGIQESTRTGSTSKILHGGWGAHAGMLAIDLAAAGVTGPSTVFEGKFGFFETHLTPITGALNFERAAAGLGARWFLPETAFKPYPCCQLLHAFIEAARRVLAEMERDGTAVGDIGDVFCQLAEPGLTLVTEPQERKKAPRTPHEARFSLPYVVAAALTYGEVDLETFRIERLGEPRVLTLAERVRFAVDPDSDYPMHCPARLTIQAGGRTYAKHVPYHPGSPEAPLGPDEVLDKFERNARWLLDDRARGLAAAAANADGARSLQSIVEQITSA